ncbi:KPN_02809 family neutral zinc metallopeptidase [Pasteurella testudinis]|uniref:KPN_02809 family neutral zinc metallopeptidase n=1 Tax=Pasteurella testudinis TaxID=761 RepID=UPI004059D8C1
MRWQGRKQSSNVEDRRGASGGGGFGGKGGGIVGLLIILVGAYFGVDLSGLVDTTGISGGQSYQSTLSEQEEQQLNAFSRVVLADTEVAWEEYFAKSGQRYVAPTMVLYNYATQTSCGTGQAAMGPFYCPNDQRVYLDLSFYKDMSSKLRASGDAAFAYVIAHEVGHHVQNLLGILPKVQQAQQRSGSQAAANQLSVKLELQADCFAGIWGYYADKNGILESGDLEEAFNAAEAVGDDRLQKQSQGYVVPDSFTHGTSAQRLAWFKRGLQSGDIKQCNPFG